MKLVCLNLDTSGMCKTNSINGILMIATLRVCSIPTPWHVKTSRCYESWLNQQVRFSTPQYYLVTINAFPSFVLNSLIPPSLMVRHRLASKSIWWTDPISTCVENFVTFGQVKWLKFQLPYSTFCNVKSYTNLGPKIHVNGQKIANQNENFQTNSQSHSAYVSIWFSSNLAF